MTMQDQIRTTEASVANPVELKLLRTTDPRDAFDAPLAVNVGMTERHISIAAGSVLALLGAQRRSVFGLVLAGVGGGLIYRGVTGHCPAYDSIGLNTIDES